MRTEELLKQSQSLAVELQTRQEELTETNYRLEAQARTLQASEERLKQQQEELQQTNEELEEKAELLAKQNAEVEKKNREIEQARMSLEEKAEQLALTSKYKSEFLANMSHELRTPLNSLLILSKLLSENTRREPQSETGRVRADDSLVGLGSARADQRDPRSVEDRVGDDGCGREAADVRGAAGLRRAAFKEVATSKGLDFGVSLDSQLPPNIETDPKRLQQVLKNLLSNALKFTDTGSVRLNIEVAEEGWGADQRTLNTAPR